MAVTPERKGLLNLNHRFESIVVDGFCFYSFRRILILESVLNLVRTIVSHVFIV